MSSPEQTVYLEDLQIISEKKKAKVAESPLANGSPSSSGTTTTTKRQRSIKDMFPTSQRTSFGEPVQKKPKISSSSVSGASLSSTAVITRLSAVKLNAIPFSLSAYQASLSEEQISLLKLECESMGNSWLKVLKDEIKKEYFLELKRFLWEQGVRGISDSPQPVKVYPPAKDIYSWSNTPLGKIKVVIIGQDPYHNPNQAHGLSFSVPPGVGVPPSLKNIYAELKAEYPDFVAPNHGNLTAWAANGVLMLNACLTVQAHKPNSHSSKGWEQFTDKVVDVIDKYGGANLPGVNSETGFGRGIVFLAWGNFAGQRVAKLSTTKHLILKSAHPSPYSANKGFFGNGHFKAANEWLEKKYGEKGVVDWSSL